MGVGQEWDTDGTAWDNSKSGLLQQRSSRPHISAERVTLAMTFDNEQEIWDLHAAGYTIRAIARELGYPRTTVHRVVQRLRASLAETLDAITARCVDLTDDELIELERAVNAADLAADPDDELALYRVRHLPR
jgi:DNA-binding NarL/FixJ family response regulator